MGKPVDPLPEGLPAEVYQWGTPKAEFRVPGVRMIVVLIILALLSIGLLLALLLSNASTKHSLVISILIAGLFAFGLFGRALQSRQWRNRGLRVWVFPQGFLRIQGSQVKVVRWDEVETVTKQMFRRYREVAEQPTFTVKLQNGEEIQFEALPGMDELGDILYNETAHVKGYGPISEKGIEVFYCSPVTEAEARKVLGKLVILWGSGEGDKSVRLLRGDSGYEVRFVVKKGAETDAYVVSGFQDIGQDLSDALDGARVDIHLCDAQFNTLKSIPRWKVKIPGEQEAKAKRRTVYDLLEQHRVSYQQRSKTADDFHGGLDAEVAIADLGTAQAIVAGLHALGITAEVIGQGLPQGGAAEGS
jgi:hypothetical protein